MDYNCACGDAVRRCSSYIEDCGKAIRVMEQIRAKIPEEAIEATGRIRDRFQFVLPYLDIAIRGDEEKAEIQSIVNETLARVDMVRNEMLKQGTKYIPHSLPQDLNHAVDRIEETLMRHALQEVEECVCERHHPMEKRGAGSLQPLSGCQ